MGWERNLHHSRVRVNSESESSDKVLVSGLVFSLSVSNARQHQTQAKKVAVSIYVHDKGNRKRTGVELSARELE